MYIYIYHHFRLLKPCYFKNKKLFCWLNHVKSPI